MASIKLTTVSKDHRPIYTDGGRLAAGSEKAVTLDSTTVDAGNSPTTLLRPGLVVGKGTGNRWYDAGDGAVIGPTQALHLGGTSPTIAGAEAITVKINGGESITVTTATADTTAALVAAALNADPQFASGLFASDQSGQIQIESVEAGEHFYFEIVSSVAGWNLTAGTYVGTDGEFGVLEDYMDMLDPSGVVANQHGVTVSQRGRYLSTNLLGLTAEARAFLKARSSTFEA